MHGLDLLVNFVKSFLISFRVCLSLRSLFFIYWMELSRVVGECKFIGWPLLL